MENIDFNNLVTKQDLKSETDKIRQEMATKEDLKKTNDDLSKFYWQLDSKIDKSINDFREEVDKRFDQVLMGSDKQIKIMEEMRSELAAHNASYKRHDEKIEDIEEDIEDHEQRIAVLEFKPAM